MCDTLCALCCNRSAQKHGSKSRSKSRQPTSIRSTQSPARSFADGLSDAWSSTSFVPKSFTGKTYVVESGDDVQDAAEHKKKLRDLKALMKRLEGPVQKFPKSGKGLMRKPQDRYVVVVPGEEVHPSASKDTSLSEIDCLKNGQLAYWESSTAYKQNNDAKGFILLLKIAKVWVSKDDSKGKSVVVKHKVGSEMQEMVLCFPTKRDAEEWSYALWEFISKLRGQEAVIGGQGAA
mmetsp:Transcript_68940/g.109400  ORF Transcript_68940/g.109400 Transcript_68940/m.109400 type:complete len:234 (-) Transcript_68940:161-862(-)